LVILRRTFSLGAGISKHPVDALPLIHRQGKGIKSALLAFPSFVCPANILYLFNVLLILAALKLDLGIAECRRQFATDDLGLVLNALLVVISLDLTLLLCLVAFRTAALVFFIMFILI
jgi:hypothetical protein